MCRSRNTIMNSNSKKKKTPVFPLSDEELRNLSEIGSGISLRKNHRCHLELQYSTLPINSNHFKKSVSEELNNRVLKYNPKLNEMILRYANIRIVTPVEANRCRKLKLVCIADIYVFNPLPDSILTGTVNKISKSHIGCVIYDVFNVSIMKPANLPHSQWAGRHVNINDSVTFKVVKVDISEVIPYIVGNLVAENDDQISSRESDEKDSLIRTDQNSCVTSEELYSDLKDISEAIKDVESRKRKRSVQTEITPKRKRKRVI